MIPIAIGQVIGRRGGIHRQVSPARSRAPAVSRVAECDGGAVRSGGQGIGVRVHREGDDRRRCRERPRC